MSSPFVVKILSGLHEGAQMEIPQEGLILGSDDTCDLLLFDPQIAPRHLRLVPTEGGESIILSSLDGEVVLDGVLIEGETSLEGPTQVVVVGGIHLVVGIANQEWPEIVFPDGNQVIQEKVPEDYTPFSDVDIRKKKKKGTKKFLSFFIFLLIFVMGLYISYWVASKDATKGSGEAIPSGKIASFFVPITQQLKKFSDFWEQMLPEKSASKSDLSKTKKSSSLSSANKNWPPLPLEALVTQSLLREIPQVVFSMNEEGSRKQFDVWVRGEQAVSVARRIFGPVSPPILYNVIDLAQVEASAATLAQLFGISLQVRVEPEGIAFWMGYQRDEANWQVFSSHASRELPAIREHRSEVIFGNRLVLQLREDLEKQGLSNIRPVAAEDGLRIEGSFLPEQKRKWDLWIARIRESYGAQISIAEQVYSSSQTALVKTTMSVKEFFPSQIMGISGTIMPWVSLADGSKLFPGAKLKKGYILEAITANSLRLNGPEGKVDFPVSTLE